MNMSIYKVKKVLNNNIVLCINDNSKEECIISGKGIGFKYKTGDILDLNSIEKIYFTHDRKNINQYEKLLPKCSDELIDVVEEIIDLMSRKFDTEYDEYIHIALLDHLNFSIYRYENKISVSNIFLDEISMIYDEIYEFSKFSLHYINEKLGIRLPESEIAFITLHIHSALNKQNVSKVALYMQIIEKCIALVEEEIGYKLDSKSIEKTRLITHLKFALKRAEEKMYLHENILDTLKLNYPKAHHIASKIADLIQEEFQMEVQSGEVGYLTLHIQNIIVNSPKSEG